MDDAIAAMRQYVQKYKSTEFHQMVGADLGKIAEKIAEQHGVNHYALMNACGFSR